MKFRSILIMLLCSLVLSKMEISAAAVPLESVTNLKYTNAVTLSNVSVQTDKFDYLNGEARATNRFDWSISSGVIKKASTAFSLEMNEVVTINCTFSPSATNVDFGLIAPDGRFLLYSSDRRQF